MYITVRRNCTWLLCRRHTAESSAAYGEYSSNKAGEDGSHTRLEQLTPSEAQRDQVGSDLAWHASTAGQAQ